MLKIDGTIGVSTFGALENVKVDLRKFMS